MKTIIGVVGTVTAANTHLCLLRAATVSTDTVLSRLSTLSLTPTLLVGAFIIPI